jgi:serine/threonine protein kinase
MGGCIQSKEEPNKGVDAPKDPGSNKLGSRQQDMRLLEEYSVGQTLGEGAFGVVSNCKHRVTGQEYAVKMVDKVETPVDQIKKEAAMLESLNHPNIVKFHGVYYERCFVCIVMDKYSGGDLVEGLQKHLKERGQINCHHVTHVARQMGASVQYLHNKGVIHRDVKGDNYLMDRRDMTDLHCKVVLTDFGTACHVSEGERLNAAVGTKIFWAPEFFDKNYGVKVDVWATGVIMYGLVTGRFPFRDEADIRAKEVKIPKRVHPTCEEFIKKMLEKKEALRFDSNQVMAHAWVAEGGKKASDSGSTAAHTEEGEEADTANLRVDDANDGIKERRQELINRLNKEHEGRNAPKPTASQSNHAEGARFTLKDKAGNKMVYEWWDKIKAKRSGINEIDESGPSGTTTQGGKGTDLDTFKTMLQEHKIDVSGFGTGKAKTLPQLAHEVESGAARLMLDAAEHKKLVRVCDLVVLIIRSPDDLQRVLIETNEQFPDGRKRETNRLPGTKKEPHENTRQTAHRILQDMMRIDPKHVNIDLQKILRVEEEIESPSYPGVTSVYRKEIVECVVNMPADALKKVGMPGFNTWEATDSDKNTKFFSWMTTKEAEAKKVKLLPEKQETSTLVKAPIGMNEEALRQALTKANIDSSKFGTKLESGVQAKSLKEFSAELIKGESTLLQDDNSQLLRVVDVVVLIIKRKNGDEILVQTEQTLPDGKKTILNRLPGAKRRPDENQFLSARRIIRRQLEIEECSVQFDTNVQSIEEEKPSPNYPGLKTVYRKRLITANMVSQ